jgi:hypothetical protein
VASARRATVALDLRPSMTCRCIGPSLDKQIPVERSNPGPLLS